MNEKVEDWIDSVDYRFCKCGSQHKTLEALKMHIKDSHVNMLVIGYETKYIAQSKACPNCGFDYPVDSYSGKDCCYDCVEGVEPIIGT